MYKLSGVYKSMYEPSFNSVLVQIDDEDAKYGSGNDESMLGKSFSKGTVIKVGDFIETNQYPDVDDSVCDDVLKLVDKQIIWNEGAESGTTFEHDGKLYGLIYWYDIRAAKASK